MNIFTGSKKEEVKNVKATDTKQKSVSAQGAAVKHRVRLARPVLKRPHASEKAHFIARYNKYVFVVEPNANKSLIKQDVENRYGVKVQRVATLEVKGKMKRVGMQKGRRSGLKKAIVTLKEGYKIELT